MSEQAGSNLDNKRNLILLIAAFAAVYIIWGSTYLAIKYAIETIPTFLMAGFRFTIAGGLLYLWARLSPGYEKPKPVHWRTSLVVGILLLAGGNGGVVVGEHYISSSLTALLIATTPFCIVLLNWAVLRGQRPNLLVSAGLLLGFVGVLLLLPTGAPAPGSTVTAGEQLFGTVLILAASLSWAIGSLYGTRAAAARSPILASGMQMLLGGIVLLLMGTIAGEWSTLNFGTISARSWIALAYLIFIGAIVAFTAYSWLLKNAQPAMVSTYAYVNPAIAVLLGWAIAGETLTGQMLVGAAIIVGSVALITSTKKNKKEEAIAPTISTEMTLPECKASTTSA
jgi:drug/metabolite transporter (DMT)-like permease